MKRTIPWLITATAGLVLITAAFIPATESWGEVASIWFDILAAIAFILGGGNLLAMQLKKISDRKAGWGYAAVTLISFLVMLVAGSFKLGSSPAKDGEYFGETFAPLAIADIPAGQVARIDGSLPTRDDKAPLPKSVQRQLSVDNGQLVFRGWMQPNQAQELKAYKYELAWHALVEELEEKAQPPAEFAGRVNYYADHEALSYAGPLTDDVQQRLLVLDSTPAWQTAVNDLAERSRRASKVTAAVIPEDLKIPSSLESSLKVDRGAKSLELSGPLSASDRDALADQFQPIKPFTAGAQTALVGRLDKLAPPLTEHQRKAVDATLRAQWTVPKLRDALDAAGAPQQVPKSARELLAERQAGATTLVPTRTVGTEVKLNDAQVRVLDEFAADPEARVQDLPAKLAAAGPFEPRQAAALANFFATVPTLGMLNRELYLAIAKAGPVSAGQRDDLLAPYREQLQWRRAVGELFIAAHVPKYPWSGEYRQEGNLFWWLYEYAFNPLTATMFAMLAFYVASAAFRAFRAKNIEAALLLGTAFIILLGRTFAGVLLTGWLPESLSGLRIENLTVFITNVFALAGNRAIMIGIALGLASMSVRVLLGIDRSYLGSRED